MINQSRQILTSLERVWKGGSMRDVFSVCRTEALIAVPERLTGDLSRPPRPEDYNEELHTLDKEDWLADAFFAMPAVEVGKYCEFMTQNSAYSTQHGVKGEEYKNVLVVYDDLERVMNFYGGFGVVG